VSIDAKFVFLLDGYKEKYLSQFRLCLHSLRTRGGRARDTECVLVYLGDVEPQIEGFCREHGVTLQPETPMFGHPRRNKPLMCRVERGDAICLLDMDILFAGDPTPALETCVAEDKICVAAAGTAPIRHNIREPWLRPVGALYHAHGWREWRKLFAKHAGGKQPPAPMIRSRRGHAMLPNHNTAVTMIPQRHVQPLREVWQKVIDDLIEIEAQNQFLARYLNLGHTNQIAFGVAMHALGVGWNPLDCRYHFSRLHAEDPEKREMLRRGEVAIVHYAGKLQSYLLPEDPGPIVPEQAQMHALARAVVGEMNARPASRA
jgi:hypothetical protein